MYLCMSKYVVAIVVNSHTFDISHGFATIAGVYTPPTAQHELKATQQRDDCSLLSVKCDTHTGRIISAFLKSGPPPFSVKNTHQRCYKSGVDDRNLISVSSKCPADFYS